MITIILENREGMVFHSVSFPGNEQYLIRDEEETKFPLLSELDEFSYDVFSSTDMVELITELRQVRETVAEADQTHIDEIIAMAFRCRDDKTLVLSFTPFDE